MIPRTIAPIIHPLAEAPGVRGVAVFDETTCFLENLPRLSARQLLDRTASLFAAPAPGPGRGSASPIILDCDGARLVVLRFHRFAIAALLNDEADISAIADLVQAFERPITQLLPKKPLPRRVARLSVLRWSAVEPVLIDVLSTVIARPLAQGLVRNEMRHDKLEGQLPASPLAVRTFCNRILLQVPFKSRHDGIRTQLAQKLTDF